MGMIYGMTGFASVKKASPLAEIEMDAISRNARYLDVRVLGQVPFLEAEKIILDAVRASGISRGTIKVQVKIKMKAVSYNVSINKNLLAELKSALRNIGMELPSQMSFDDLSSVPDLLQFYPKNTKGLAALFQSTSALLMKKLKSERGKEGKAMARLLSGLIKEASGNQRKIEKLLRELKKKGRLVIAHESVDGEKDIFEEVKRLKMVFSMLNAAIIKKSGPKGKDLDFICQEALRETNTILAKIKDPGITKEALSLKTIIDRMREISQNIE